MSWKSIGVVWMGLTMLVVPVAASTQQPVTVESLLLILHDVSALAHLRDYRTRLYSSYDRSGGNNDFQNFLKVEDKVGVLLDADGPGAVVRIWSANAEASGRLRVYVDGSSTPVIDVPFKNYFAGPLGTHAAGGYVSYFPLPYQRHCRIEVTSPDHLYYQVNTIQWDVGTKVISYKSPLSKNAVDLTAQVNQLWNLDASEGLEFGKEIEVKKKKTLTILQMNSAGVLQKLALKFPRVSRLGDLRRVVVRAFFDGHKNADIEAPITDFFGNAWANSNFKSILASQMDNVMSVSAPMPFSKSARFTIENGMNNNLSFQVAFVKADRLFDGTTDGYFHAQFNEGKTVAGQPHRWLQVAGQRGHIVGVIQAMQGPKHQYLRYLEGDEQIRVDDEKWIENQVGSTVIGPWNGTGTEDYFNSGWYFLNLAKAFPTHGAVVREDNGSIAAYRWHFLDTPTFKNSIDAQLEHGDENTNPNVYYSSVVYWYSNGESPRGRSSLRASQVPLLPDIKFLVQ